jgi:uncharacterized protein
MIVVSNTSPINNLAAIGQLGLLQQLYGKIVIPRAVYQELLNAGTTDPGVLAVQTFDWIEIRLVTNLELLQTLQSNLDAGEAEAIALAVELKANRLIIDERRGRHEVNRLGFEAIGLLGILLAAKQRRIIPQVKPLLDDLRDRGFWVREALYAEVLKLAGE